MDKGVCVFVNNRFLHISKVPLVLRHGNSDFSVEDPGSPLRSSGPNFPESLLTVEQHHNPMSGAVLEVASDLLSGLSQHPTYVVALGLLDGIVVLQSEIDISHPVHVRFHCRFLVYSIQAAG